MLTRRNRAGAARRAWSVLSGVSIASVFGIYVVFPAALAVRCRFRPRPLRTDGPDVAAISVVIAAYNESASIVAKLDDLAAQHIRGLQVIVASDGSTDATVALALAHPSRPTVLDLERQGKAAVMNRAMQEATGEVVVFTDANSRLGPEAVATLVAPFRDRSVGGVAGDQRYGSRPSGTADGERAYWSYERTIKRWESCAGSVVSSTGTLHAIRRDLVDVIPPDVTDDFYLSVGVVLKHYRLVFAEQAVAWEQPNDRAAAEYRRRVRIITRGLTGVRRRRDLLDPRRYGAYSSVLAIHKVGRRLVFVPMLSTLVSSLALRRTSLLWAIAFRAQVGFYGLAAVGALSQRTVFGRLRIVALPSHFVLANAAAAHAASNLARSQSFVTWTPERS